SGLGFGSQLKESNKDGDDAKLLRMVEPHDLVKFGLIPELVGRLPIVTVLDSLDETALVRILKEPKNSIVKQYKALFALDNVELEITDDALHEIAQKAIKLKSGARGLRSIVEQVLMETMYEVPSDPTIIKVTVDAEAVRQTAKPKLE